MTDDYKWHQEETYKSLMQYGSMSLKFVMVSNGGAAIGLLSFAGNLIAKQEQAMDIHIPMIIFVLGIVFGGLGMASAYFTQLSLYEENQKAKPQGGHQRYLWACIILVILV